MKHPAHIYCTIRCRNNFNSKKRNTSGKIKGKVRYMPLEKYKRLMNGHDALLAVKVLLEKEGYYCHPRLARMLQEVR
jgi:hypothetical protein